jgi:adenylate cyclase
MGHGVSRIAPVLEWLVDAALGAPETIDLLRGCAERLDEAGFHVARAHFSASALHPRFRGLGVTWRRGAVAEVDEYLHASAITDAWTQSPINFMLSERVPFMRRRLDRNFPELRFPILAELAATGLTDWAAWLVSFHWPYDRGDGNTVGVFISLCSDRAGGFTDVELADLQKVTRAFAAAVKARGLELMMRDLLGAYVGRDAATRVLSGAVTRGSVERIDAVIMMADMKGFTRLSNERPIGEVLELLNSVFDILGQRVEAHGGQILKFMGDGALVVFLLEGRTTADAVDAALATALEVQELLPERAAMDIGIHVGEVHYGNIGASERLDFTAIGAAVNRAARLEGLCETLSRPILISADAAAHVSMHSRSLEALGAYSVKGFAEPIEVFGLARRIDERVD